MSPSLPAAASASAHAALSAASAASGASAPSAAAAAAIGHVTAAAADAAPTAFDAALARHALLGPLLLRVALGVVFIAHALAKPLVFTFAGAEAFFASQGFPAWSLYPVFLLELLGGVALLAGFRTRWAALALIPVMLGALKPHLANGWMFNAPNGGGWEYVAFLIFSLGAVAFVGGGAFSVDAALARSRARARVGASSAQR